MKPGVITAFAIIAAVTLSGCSGKEAPKKEGPVAAKPMSVKTVKVEGRTIDRTIEATGALQAINEVVVGSETPGTVAKIIADLGDRVKAGDTLARLDDREARLNLEDAEAAYQTSVKSLEKSRAIADDATVTFKRYEQLFKDGMVSASQFDAIRTQYDVAVAGGKEAAAKVEQAASRRNLAKKRLSDTVIVSPIDGEIRKRFISAGEQVKDKAPLYAVVSGGTLKFKGTVSESAVPMIKTGQPIAVTVEAFRDISFGGVLTRVSPAIDPETRTLDIEARIPNEKNLLKPGFFAKGAVLTKRDAGVPFLPESAVYSFVGITKVFVIKDGKAGERQVKLGAKQGDLVEIIGDVKPGDTAAATGLANLYDGAAVGVNGN